MHMSPIQFARVEFCRPTIEFGNITAVGPSRPCPAAKDGYGVSLSFSPSVNPYQFLNSEACNSKKGRWIMRTIKIASALMAAMGLSAGLGQAALSADLPARPAYQAPAAVAPVQNWTGCYVGGNVGYAWGRGEISNVTGAGAVSGSNSGLAGGAQVGCDYQAGAMVFGIRNLIDWSNLSSSGQVGGGTFAGYTATNSNNWMDLLTARVGYAVQPAWLLYVQGGAAWRNSDQKLLNPAGTQVGEVSSTRTGYTVGLGSEYKFAPGWSAFIEYNYANFGSNTVSIPVPAVGTFTGNAKSDAQMVLAGVNWRFCRSAT